MKTHLLKKTEIHPTAVIHPWARIGEGVKIGPYTVIGENVEIGDECEIGSNVLIEGATRIGKRNRIFHGSAIGTAPQDLKYNGEQTFLVIGDDNVVREFVSLNLATGDGETTSIGSRCLLMVGSHVAHDCTVGDGVIITNNSLLGGHVTVGDKAFISGAVGVHQFCRIGRLAMVGGQARVTQDVPPFVTVDGGTTMIVGLNKVGLRRAGFSADEINYFTLHVEQDEDHGRWLEEALARFGDGAEAQAQIRRGALASLEARSRFWDGVQRAVVRFRQPRAARPDGASPRGLAHELLLTAWDGSETARYLEASALALLDRRRPTLSELLHRTREGAA